MNAVAHPAFQPVPVPTDEKISYPLWLHWLLPGGLRSQQAENEYHEEAFAYHAESHIS